MTNDDWIAGFQILLFILFIVGVLILIAHDIHVEHQTCIQHGGQWVHGLNTSGDREFYCIEPKGL
jgi:hypothetical protein